MFFYRVGCRMKLTGLPENYNQWTTSYVDHLKNEPANKCTQH